jgi:hypothetical protein
MMTTNPTRGLVGVLAPMLAVWLFLAGAAPAQAQEPVDAQEFEQTLRVSLWHGKDSDEVYRRGEPLNVTFQANEDAYAVVYHIDVEGRVSVLWPTSRYSDGFVFGGHEYRLPSRGGEQLRTESEEGQGFFHAVVSSYPFDLRDLELDFHHEPEAVAHDFYVAGDPFLAMNEVNYVVTGLEDPSQYAVSNYTSYYVHRPVDHPRYLCFQCHDGNESYDPYQDTCTITIEYDYGWHNQWWDNRGYYPVYYYPAYVYVDPWAGVHWVNYWYDPWYSWPSSSWYTWRWDAYAWQHSPYWRHDVRVARKYENRRYRPLDRDLLGRDRSEARTKSDLVRDDRPSDERIRSMKERTVLTDARSGRTTDEARDRIRGAGGTTRERVDRERQPREQERFEPRPTTRSTSPGLRLDGERTGGSRVSRPPSERNDGARVRTDDRAGTRVRPDRDDTRVSPPSRPQPDRTQPRVSPRSSRRGDDRQTIRPVQPRQESNRNWSTRRSQGSSNQRPSPPPPRVDSNRESRVRKPDPPRNTNQGGSSGRTVQPRTPSKPPSKPAPPPKAPSRSGGGDRTKQRSSGGRG